MADPDRPTRRTTALAATTALLLVLATVAASAPATAQSGPPPAETGPVVALVAGPDGTATIEHTPNGRPGTLAQGPEVTYQALTEMSNDIMRPIQWSLDRVGAESVWTHADGRRQDNGSPILIAVVDSGVDRDHPDLAGQIRTGGNFVGFVPVAGEPVAPVDSDVSDGLGHGTHVTGIIAAVADNNIGIAGMSPGVSILPVRVLDDSGQGTNTQLAAGILWAVSQGADIINLSLGTTSEDPVVQAAVQHAVDHDVAVLAAVGNCGSSGSGVCGGTLNAPVFPAAWPETVAIAATSSPTRSDPWLDERATFSTQATWVDLAAPGVDIHGTTPGGAYSAESGTSMAAAVATGTAALVWARYPADSATGLRDRLYRSALDLGPTGSDQSFGHGLVQPLDAVTAAGEVIPLAGLDPAERAAILLDQACPAGLATPGFDDVDPDAPHGDAIGCVAAWSIALGVGDGLYAPNRAVTRAQMATFLDRLITTTDGRVPSRRGAVPDAFGDDDGADHEGAINRLAAAGIVAGRDDGTYGPADPVTRAQMATFLDRTATYRATTPLPTAEHTYTDTDGSTHEPAIARVTAAGIALGVGDGLYAPNRAVTRAQMATFLGRTTGRLVAEGHTTHP
ncbi:MAG: S8 family serine peptidase [Acidimicrobiales bacterium]|nr:S8 family serine peptidase [Acidimicrobiales bacterium]